jgi:hypothetical protein
MSEYFGGMGAVAGGLANQEQLRRNAIRKLEAEGKIEKGSLEKKMPSIDHDGEAAKNKEVGNVEATTQDYQGARHIEKDSDQETTTTVYEAPRAYATPDHGSTSDPNASKGMKSAMQKLSRKCLNK